MHSYLIATLLLVHLLGLAGGASLTAPAVTFTNVVYTSVGAVSFNINFLQAVTSLNAQHLHLVNTANGAAISLSGSSFTSSNGGKTWTVANSAGFYPSNPNAQLTISFTNAPANVCPSPVSLVSVSSPTTIVGTGTAASCTEAAFTTAVAAGGIITFNCGSAPVTLTVTSCKNVTLARDTIIDGGGLVTLSGGGTTRILAIQTYYNYLTPRVTLQNLAFTGGYTTDVANTTSTTQGGGALYRLGGAFTIMNCDFYGNQGPATGQDVAGGAIYSVGGNDTTIVGSTFSGNKCSNGGGIGNLGNNFAIYNSIVNGNSATGTGANPGNGGNGGGICLDGNGVSTYVCGTNVNYNSAGALGGALFRVGYGATCPLALINSTFGWNSAVQSAGGVYVQNMPVTITNVAILFNAAPGIGGLALQVSATFTISQLTVANNTAATGLAGGIYNAGSGTISDSTIIGNNATAAFAAAFSGGSSTTTLTRTVIAYQQEGNIYVALSCQSEMSGGGGNFQWPAKRKDNNNDTLCTPDETEKDPLFAPVADNGCEVWTSAPLAGSPAVGSGSRCAAGSISPIPVLIYSSGQVVPRGPFSLTFQQAGGATSPPTGAPTTKPSTPAPTPAPTAKPATPAPTPAPTTKPSTPAPTTAPTGKPISVVCVANIGESATATITCPSGSQTIIAIQFASYGTPTGSCESFAASSCSASTSVSYTQTQCLNKNSCSIAVGNGAFGDPCPGTVKHFDAQVACQ